MVSVIATGTVGPMSSSLPVPMAMQPALLGHATWGDVEDGIQA